MPLLRYAWPLLGHACPVLGHARIVHASGAPQPGVLVVEHRLRRTPLRLCGIPHRAPLAAHGAARPHAADPDDRAYREAGQREGGGHHQKQLLQRCGRLCRRRLRSGGRNLICRGLLHFLGLWRLGCGRVGGGDLEIGWIGRSALVGASFHRIDDSGAGASTFGMAARGLFCTAGAGAAATVRGSTLAGEFGSARGCWETHSARASAIDLRVIVRCCGGAGSAAAEDGAGAEAGGAARANLSSAVSLSSRRYQH